MVDPEHMHDLAVDPLLSYKQIACLMTSYGQHPFLPQGPAYPYAVTVLIALPCQAPACSVATGCYQLTAAVHLLLLEMQIIQWPGRPVSQ